MSELSESATFQVPADAIGWRPDPIPRIFAKLRDIAAHRPVSCAIHEGETLRKRAVQLASNTSATFELQVAST